MGVQEDVLAFTKVFNSLEVQNLSLGWLKSIADPIIVQLLVHRFEITLKIMKGRLLAVFLLNLCITVAEILGGIFSRSYALFSDALHNLQDALSQLFSLLAIYLSEKGRTRTYTFGFKRYEILVAILNGGIILILSALMIYKGIVRAINPEIIKFSILLPVSIIGLVANVVSVMLLHRHASKSLNIKSTYLHLLSDALSSVAVVVGAIVMKVFHFYSLDGILTILIGLLILRESIKVVVESLKIILQASPFPVDEGYLLELLKGIDGVKGIHHVHVWSLKDGETHLEAHLEVEDMMVGRSQEIVRKASELLKDKMNINHITLQLESGFCNNAECSD